STQEIASLGGIRNNAPVFTSTVIVIFLSSIALPLTSGFVGEFLLINAVFQYNVYSGAFAGTTMIFSAVYMLRNLQATMLGETNAVTKIFTDLDSQEKWVLYPIVVAVILIGVFPTPLLHISEGAVNDLLKIMSEYHTGIGK